MGKEFSEIVTAVERDARLGTYVWLRQIIVGRAESAEENSTWLYTGWGADFKERFSGDASVDEVYTAVSRLGLKPYGDDDSLREWRTPVPIFTIENDGSRAAEIIISTLQGCSVPFAELRDGVQLYRLWLGSQLVTIPPCDQVAFIRLVAIGDIPVPGIDFDAVHRRIVKLAL